MNEHAARMNSRRRYEMSIESDVAGGAIDLSVDENVSYGGVTEQK